MPLRTRIEKLEKEYPSGVRRIIVVREGENQEEVFRNVISRGIIPVILKTGFEEEEESEK
jgi:putative cell wall-binding protein